MWHVCGSAALFYLYQSIPKDKIIPNIHIEPGKKHEYYGYFSTLAYLYSFGLVEKHHFKV